MITPEEQLTPKYLSSLSSDKQAFKSMNSHVVKLLQQKLLPLKRQKYNHLQKINLALRKDQHFLKANSVPSLHHHPIKRTSHAKITVASTSRTEKHHFTQELLLNQLKKLHHSSENTSRLEKRGKIDKCLEEVERKMADFEKESHEEIERHQHYCKKSRGSKKRIPFLDLALRAERHLRQQKHQLRQTYLQEHEGRRTVKPTELQKISTHFKQSPLRQTSDAQLQRQLLQDIRETMLQQKINRIKRDINHKKIVQLR